MEFAVPRGELLGLKFSARIANYATAQGEIPFSLGKLIFVDDAKSDSITISVAYSGPALPAIKRDLKKFMRRRRRLLFFQKLYTAKRLKWSSLRRGKILLSAVIEFSD